MPGFSSTRLMAGLALALTITAVAVRPAATQDVFPSKPIKIVIPEN